MRLIFLFLDGVGLGSDDPSVNPLAVRYPGFARFTDGGPWTLGARNVHRPGLLFRGIDACLGLGGLPQSGTGQASLLTGINCAALAGRHYGPLPHSTSREALRERSLYRLVTRALGPDAACFANAFPAPFFDAVRRRDRWPVITRACLDAGIRIRNLEDLAAGRAVAADGTGLGLATHLGLDVPVRTPEESADALLRLASEARFTLFEVFQTDKAGHAQSHEGARAILGAVDRLLERLVQELPGDTTLLVTSDHGNVEDLSVRTHTRHPVPLAVLGPGAEAFAEVGDLTGVAPAILRVLGLPKADSRRTPVEPAGGGLDPSGGASQRAPASGAAAEPRTSSSTRRSAP